MSDDNSNVTDKASEIAKNIWLAGLGAYGKAFDEAQDRLDKLDKASKEPPRLFKDLVKKGEQLEDEVREQLSSMRKSRTSSVERYDPRTNTWTDLPPMGAVRSDASAVAYHGKIYVIGGFTGNDVLNSVEIYDPELNQWNYGPPLNTQRSGVKAIVFQDQIFAVGGFSGAARLNSVECLHSSFSRQSWENMPSMLKTRSNFGICCIDDKILVMGGYDGQGVTDRVESYDTKIRLWTQEASLKEKKSALVAVTLSGN